MKTSNYDHIRDTNLPEFRGTGRLFRHRQSGCEIYHLHNDDEENLFGFMLKTVPPDSTGVAHILEHTVLCGSERYPVKDPFLLLLKGSMYTFLNALTFPDKTVYPASSTVPQDLFNLMKVYGDAVFFPLLKEEMFRQEGHRLVLNEDGSLDFSGVVYNEMKGAYSTHDAIAGEMSLRSLFPDTAYGHDSGGNPREIPNLSYEQFLDFHRRYYHPSNARIFLYGNIDTEDYLSFLHEEFLRRFSLDDPGAGADISVDLQPRWSEPRRITSTYPTDQEETAGMTSVTLNWLVADMDRPEMVLACEALADILLGSSGAPLYKALVESGLGEDLSSPSGLETELREISFSAGLRGTDPERADEIEALVFDTLTSLRDSGIDPDVIEGTLRKMAFSNIERPGSGFGLRLMRRAARSWLHGGAPEDTMCFEAAYSGLKKRLEDEPRFFEGLIDELLLSNPHRTTLIVEPDRDYERREREAVAEQLREIESRLDETALQELRRQQETLERIQSEPDPPEALASIPFLTINDVPRTVEHIPSEVASLPGGGTLLQHELDTGGIIYLDMVFDLSGVEDELLPYLPLFATVITDIGLPGESYDSVARRLDLTTGGFNAGVSAAGHLDEARAVNTLGVRVKALSETADEGFALAFDLLRRADFSDHRRLRDLLLEERNDIRSAVIPEGSAFAWTHAAAGLSQAAVLRDTFRGVRQLEHMCALDTEGDLTWLEERFESIRSQVFRQAGVTAAIGSEADGLSRGERLLREFLDSLPAGAGEPGSAGQTQGAADNPGSAGVSPGAAGDPGSAGQTQGAADNPGSAGVSPGAAGDPGSAGQTQGAKHPIAGLGVPGGVGYVARVVPGARLGEREYAWEGILAHMLRTGFLWERIRMKGGAYGAFALQNGTEGLFAMASYRDPNIVKTFEAFRDALAAYSVDPPGMRDVELSVIGMIGSETRPMSPSQKNIVSARRFLTGVTDDIRQARRDALIAAEPGDIARVAENLRQRAAERSSSCVIASHDALEQASIEIPELKDTMRDLPV